MKNNTAKENEELTHFQFDLGEHMSTLQSLASVCEETIALVKQLTGPEKSETGRSLKKRFGRISNRWTGSIGGTFDSQETEVEMLRELFK